MNAHSAIRYAHNGNVVDRVREARLGGVARQSNQGSQLPMIMPTSASIASMAKKIGTTPGS